MNTPLIILQARTGSSRLPEKMIKPFHGDTPILEILLRRLQSDLPADVASRIVVATTTSPGDDAIVELCRRVGVEVFRGSETDVLDRFISCARAINADRIVRVCADNVFLDTQSLLKLYRAIEADKDADYISFRTSDGTPSIRTHYGFWAEAATLQALLSAAANTDEAFFHEHVTNYLYNTPGQYATRWIDIDPYVENHKSLRLTVDTADDFAVQQQIYSALTSDSRPLTPSTIIAYLDSNPHLYSIMQRNIQANSK